MIHTLFSCDGQCSLALEVTPKVYKSATNFKRLRSSHATHLSMNKDQQCREFPGDVPVEARQFDIHNVISYLASSQSLLIRVATAHCCAVKLASTTLAGQEQIVSIDIY